LVGTRAQRGLSANDGRVGERGSGEARGMICRGSINVVEIESQRQRAALKITF
jgi:hypothetical protein